MPFETWLFFCLTEAALCITPGPAVLVVCSLGLIHGTPAALHGAAGVLAANAFYFVLSATGIGAILLASYDAFFAIKWIGAAYLIWLGIRIIRSRTDSLAVGPSTRPVRMTGSSSFLRGLLTQGANPKLLVFFAAILPQFVDPRSPLAPQIIVLGISSLVIECCVLGAYGMLAGRGGRLARRPRFAVTVHRVGGGLLIGAGLGLARLRSS